MKSKFLSVVLIAAVSLGLLLVPAVSMVSVSAATGDCGLDAVSDKDKVVFNEAFSVNVTINNSNVLPLNALQVFMIFDNSAVQVNSITTTGTPFTQVVTGPTFSNATGKISFDTGTPPGTNTTAARPYLMTINMESLSTPGNTTISFGKVPSPEEETKVFGKGLGNVLNWSRVVNATVTVGVPIMTVNITPWASGAGPAMGGIALAFNGSWVPGFYCAIPDMEAPYDEIVIPYNRTDLLPFSYPFGWNECLVVAAIDMVPGWGWENWTDWSAVKVNLGGQPSEETGLWLTLAVVKMDALSKNLTAIFGQKEPEINYTLLQSPPDKFEFVFNEGQTPESQGLFMVNSGGKTLDWNADATTDVGGDWLSVSPTSGNLTTSFTVDNVTLTVEVNSTNLLGDHVYTGNITITGNSSVDIPVIAQVNPATAINVTRTIAGTGDSGKPGEVDEVYAGETFTVYINFTVPVPHFNAIGLTDNAPDGWLVDVDESWCTQDGTPTAASAVLGTGNKAEIMWSNIDNGVVVLAWYNVTVPNTPDEGPNYWPENDCDNAWLEYYFDINGSYDSCVRGDYIVNVTVPGDLVGKTFDVIHDELPNVDVRLLLDGVGYLRSDESTPLYSNTAYIRGTYWLVANETRHFDVDITTVKSGWNFDIDLTTYGALADPIISPLPLPASNVFNFSGDYGLVPRACPMGYALTAVNLWVMDTWYHPEVRLSVWKADRVIHAWQFPS